MPWKCPVCGTDNPEDLEPRCIGLCGYSKIARRLILTSEATGQSVKMHITTPVGRLLLRNFAGDDSRYASDQQFEVIRDEAGGAWVLRHASGARNPTYYNGAAVEHDTLQLTNGGVISIGPEKMRLTVTLED